MDVLCIIDEKDYYKIPYDLRLSFKYVEMREVDEYESNKSDPIYMKLYKDKREKKKELSEYLFNKRHNKKS